MAVIDELLIGLGFEYDAGGLDQFKSDVNATTDIVKDLAKVAIAAAAAITALTIASTAASDEQGKLAFEIGESVETIDALQFALTRSGGSADGMSSSLQQLAIRASEAARGTGSGVEAFGLLGVQATDVHGKLKPVGQLMLEVSGAMQGLSKIRQIELADKLGIRESIRLLQHGPRAIRELTDEARALGVTTAEDAAISADFQDSLTDLWRIVKQISRTLSRQFAPVMNELLDLTTEWWKVNKDVIEQNIPKWIDQATMAIKLFTLAMGAFLAVRIVGHISTLIGLMRSLSLATLAANAAAFLLPLLFAGAAVAIGLLAEDAKVFFEGGDSFIGDMIKKYPEWEDRLRTIAEVFNTLAEFTTTVLDGWTQIFKLFKFNRTTDGVLDEFAGFIGDVTGLAPFGTADMGLSERTVTGDLATIGSFLVDKIEIIIQGGADTAENIATSVREELFQASRDLNSALER